MSGFAPTDEQAAVVELFGQRLHLAVSAGAGTGKTSTLRLLAASAPGRPGQYVAFNRAIVEEARQRMPPNVTVSTAHSLAFRAIGRNYAHRLDGDRMRSTELARRLKVDPLYVRYAGTTKVLQPAKLASLALRSIAVFCNSADPEPGPQHVPWLDGIDGVNDRGVRESHNNRRVAEHLAPALGRAWADLLRFDGELPYTPDCYLKAWQLGTPVVPADFILFDEAQDASPVMESIVRRQDHAQLVVVGDENQAIYEWRGAVDALSRFRADARCHLTESFRFGPAIAAVANRLLDDLGADIRLVGRGEPGRVGAVAAPNCTLSRTNAEALRAVVTAQVQGRRVHLVGGTGKQGADLRSFVENAALLGAPNKKGDKVAPPAGVPWHRDLACFTSWQEVLLYVEEDPSGTELKLWVGLIEEFGTSAILGALTSLVDEPAADVVVSTAHKAKGREWPTVALAGDFPDSYEPPELRLLYVACTRAERELDNRAVGYFGQLKLGAGL